MASCFSSASLPDEAKRWFEAATVICRYTPDGKTRAEKVRIVLYVALHFFLLDPIRGKISETYSHLLAQLSSRKSERVDSEDVPNAS